MAPSLPTLARLTGILAAAAALGAATNAAAQAGWTKRFEGDGIAVYSRTAEGARVHEVRMIGDVEAPPRACRNVLADAAAHPETLPHVAASRVVEREGETRYWVYSQFAFPVVSDRDLTLRIVEEELRTPGAGFRLRFSAANDRGPPPRDGVVRIETCAGSWEFLPLDGGKRTRAVYTLLVDPGGLVPAFLANKGTRQSLPELMNALRRAAQMPRYAAAVP